MSEKALFYNALPDPSYSTGYDRNYDADDISDFFSAVIETGVVKNTTGLKVTASSGMEVSVAAGKAVIKGKPYRNTAAKTFTVPTAPVGDANRIDAIVLRYDNSTQVRNTYLSYKTGAVNNTMPALTRNDRVYELLLAYIIVTPNSTAINNSMIYDMRGNTTAQVRVKSSDDESTTTLEVNACPYVTAVKGYDDYYDAILLRSRDKITLSSASATVIFNIPSYNSKSDMLSVYTNGILEAADNYTVSGSVITFKTQKVAGTVIEVVADKFLDGEGLETALANYTRLNNIVESLQDKDAYTYVCTGYNDNVAISNIVKGFLDAERDGNDEPSMRLNVYGTIGMSAPVRGAGTSASPYGWFDFATSWTSNNNRRITVDFTNCSTIEPTIENGTRNVIFYGEDMTIIGANVAVGNTTSGTQVRAFNSQDGSLRCERSRFWITSYQDSGIAINGTFTDCRGSVANVINNSYCFLPSNTGLLRINGGEYYAYCGSSSLQSAIVGQSSADAVSILYGVSAPTLARNSYYQTNSLLQWVGGGMMNCTDLVSALPMIVVAGISNIRGTITKSKAIE